MVVLLQIHVREAIASPLYSKSLADRYAFSRFAKACVEAEGVEIPDSNTLRRHLSLLKHLSHRSWKPPLGNTPDDVELLASLGACGIVWENKLSLEDLKDQCFM